MIGIAIRCIQHSQAMVERGVCELAHSFFHLINVFFSDDHSRVVLSSINDNGGYINASYIEACIA